MFMSSVNDLMPAETELKVRYMPKPEGEVLGYLRRGQVIECLAVIGDWLQVRYEQEDTAWVRWRITTPQSRAAEAAAQAEKAAAEAAVLAAEPGDQRAGGHGLRHRVGGTSILRRPGDQRACVHPSRVQVGAQIGRQHHAPARGMHGVGDLFPACRLFVRPDAGVAA